MIEPMNAKSTIAIVGASMAGGTAAATLREEGFEGRVVLIGDEPLPPYERPPLSKEVLRGEAEVLDGSLRPSDWWSANQIEARFGERVERLDPADRSLLLASGERIAFDRAIVATGVRNRRLQAPGVELDGVFDLRTSGDAERIRDAATGASQAVVVGMGFIGSEVAASLRQRGLDVTVIEFFQTALYRVLGVEIGRAIADMHRDQGVVMHFGEEVQRFEGDGRVERVVTRSGLRIDCDLAVVGVGTEPVVDILQGVGLDPGGGIATDATLQTEIPGVFAAGDVAAHDHPVFGKIRVEHFDNAVKMGAVAARNALGAAVVFDDPHWFWSDQYGSNLQVGGFATSWAKMVVRGSLQERKFCAFLLDEGGVLRSSVSLDWPRDVRRSLALISGQVIPDTAALADPSVDLRSLTPTPA
jgi:3-phenylpropionate/trans-cinnamate dioxygenase ferredoxin reductase component